MIRVDHNTASNRQDIPCYYNQKKTENGNIMTKAIKAYRDELLTGLTDEEKEEIEKKIKAFLKDKPIKTEADKQALNQFIMGLLSQYGYKGNCEDYAAAMGAAAIGSTEETDGKQSSNKYNEESFIAFQKNGASGEVSKIRVLK